MKEITKLMVNQFKIKEIGYDFMGYKLQQGDIYNFHHLIIPNRYGGPESVWNGAILCGGTSHPYLHLIERIDYDKFCYITSEMIDMNLQGRLCVANIRHIHDVLKQFEKEHTTDRTRKDKLLIKRQYLERVKL